MGVSKNNGTPKSSILTGFSIIFTIHFGGKTPYFWIDTHMDIPVLVSFQTKVSIFKSPRVTSQYSSWWFQPIWEILVKMGIFPK